MNRYMLGTDGCTAFGRLHGRELKERICEFGEVVMWYIPRRVRGKLDVRWRYGLFLGRSPNSDENVLGLPNGKVIRARAMLRVVIHARWSNERFDAVNMSPIKERLHRSTIDEIETQQQPHDQSRAPIGDGAEQRWVQITRADVAKHGATTGCPTCAAHLGGHHERARCLKHTETCRERLYDALRADNSIKIKLADDAGGERTKTKHASDASASSPSPPTTGSPCFRSPGASSSTAPPTPLASSGSNLDTHKITRP